MSTLFVIEAVHKKAAFEAVLHEIGIDARIHATAGHIFEMPPLFASGQTNLALDCNYRDYARRPRDAGSVDWLRKAAAECATVVVATDADREGDVIAWDVATLVADTHPEPMRMRLKGMDAESVREALAAMTPISKNDAIAGRTRAIVDRMIGGVFSANGVSVGRVRSGMLGLLASRKRAVAVLRLVAPDVSQGRPWVAECPVDGPITRDVAKRLAALDLPPLSANGRSEQRSAAPGNMGDVMVRAGDRLDMSPKEADASMQRLYEAGRMSYPRADGKGMSRATARKIDAILRKAGYGFDASTAPEKDEKAPHDAPHPIGVVSIERDPVKLGHDEGLRTMVARDLVRGGRHRPNDFAFGEPIRSFLDRKGFLPSVSAYVAGLEWRRENGPGYPGREAWPDQEVVERRPDTVVLEAVVEAGLGRPSTWAKHVTDFMSRGLVDEELGLTAKGEAWMRETPPLLLDPRTSAAIENACESVSDFMFDDPSREPWEVLAERIVEVLPPALSEPLRASIENVQPRAARDYLAEIVSSKGLDELLADRAPRHAYRPSGN